MTIVLNHTIVPARDKIAAARFFANIFGLPFDAESGHFAPVRRVKSGHFAPVRRVTWAPRGAPFLLVAVHKLRHWITLFAGPIALYPRGCGQWESRAPPRGSFILAN
jgi:hypothetical protein